MKIKSLVLALLAAIVCITFTGCNSDSPSTPTPTIFTNIVTVTAITETGTIFEFRPEGTSSSVVLTSSRNINSTNDLFKTNSRVLISYTTESNSSDVNCAINLLAVSNVIGRGEAPEELTASETQNWNSSTVSVYDIRLSGNYVDVVFTAYTSSTPTECRVVADASTIGNEYPDLYLLFEPEMLGPDCADYAIYMSYSVADIFANPSCKGVTVHFNDPNISAQQITLNKLGSALTPSTRD